LLQQNVKKIHHQLNIPPRQIGCFSGVHCNTLHVFSVFNPLVGDCPIVQQGGRLQKLLIQWLEGWRTIKFGDSLFSDKPKWKIAETGKTDQRLGTSATTTIK
jgi:hypothetical protein